MSEKEPSTESVILEILHYYDLVNVEMVQILELIYPGQPQLSKLQ